MSRSGISNHCCGLIIIIIFCILSIFPGCQFFSFNSSSTSTDQNDHLDSTLSSIKTIYVQDFTGQSLESVRNVFYEIIEEQDSFSFVELLPESFSELGVLRLEVMDHSIWENEELIPILEDNILSTEKTFSIIRRRNAIVSIKVSLYDAETGKPLVRKVFTQPYQQIYTDEQSIANRPEEHIELHRLTKLLFFRILESFNPDREHNGMVNLEEGEGYDWFSAYIYNLGDRRVKKGNRLAKTGELDQAIWTWKIVLYGATKEEPHDVYVKNRASAFYNLGIVYQQKNDWWLAAKMFAKANRLQQKLKYAQAWGENIQSWLEQQKQPGIAREDEQEEQLVVQEMEQITETEMEVRSDMIISLERNQQLMLEERDLFPLDSYIKSLQPIELDQESDSSQ